MDISTNYCGAYWNNGSIRRSRKTYDVLPVSDLDAVCLSHDCDLAIIEEEYQGDETLSLRADRKFYESASRLKGVRPYVYSNLVFYGNPLLRMGASYFKGASDFKQIIKPSLKGASVNEDVSGTNQVYDAGNGGQFVCQPLDKTFGIQPKVYETPAPMSTSLFAMPSSGESTSRGYRIEKNIPFFHNSNSNYGKRKRKTKRKAK